MYLSNLYKPTFMCVCVCVCVCAAGGITLPQSDQHAAADAGLLQTALGEWWRGEERGSEP